MASLRFVVCFYCPAILRIEDDKTLWHDCFSGFSDEDWEKIGVRQMVIV